MKELKEKFERLQSNILKEKNEHIKWLKELLLYAEGKKKWDTSKIWVCECHSLMPFNMGYSFDCKCGCPGMPPYYPQKLDIKV